MLKRVIALLVSLIVIGCGSNTDVGKPKTKSVAQASDPPEEKAVSATDPVKAAPSKAKTPKAVAPSVSAGPLKDKLAEVQRTVSQMTRQLADTKTPKTKGDKPGDPPSSAPAEAKGKDGATREPAAVASTTKSGSAADSSSRSWTRLKGLDIPNPKCMALSPDRKTLAVSGKSSLRLYDAASGAEIGVIQDDEKRSGWVSAAAFSPNGAWIAFSGEYHSTIQVWDVAKRSIRASFDSPYTDVYPPGWPRQGTYHKGCQIGFTTDPDLFVTAGEGSSQPGRKPNADQIILWNVHKPQPVARLKGQAPLSVAAKRPLLAYRGAEPSEIVVWDYTKQQKVKVINANFGKSSRVVAVALSPAADLLVAVVRLGDDGKTIANFPHALHLYRLDGNGSEELKSGRGNGWDEITSVAFSPDGTVLAVAGDCVMTRDDRIGLIQLVNLKTKKVASLMGHRRRVQQVVFATDGQVCGSFSAGSSGEPNEVWLWSASDKGVYEFVDPVDEQKRLAGAAADQVARKNQPENREATPPTKEDKPTPFSPKTHTRREFIEKMKEMNSTGGRFDPDAGFRVGRFTRKTFVEVFGDPDSDRNFIQNKRLWSYRCKDGIIILTVIIGDPFMLVMDVEK